MKRNVLFVILAMALAVWCGRSQTVTIDLSKVATDTNAPPVNLSAEMARAQNEHKLLLMEFGSSDSCAPCIAFEQHVFSQPEFVAYAKSNLDFVRFDFPLKHEMRPDTKATNALLARQFEVYPFPTFIALNQTGKVFWQMPDKNDPDPKVDLKLMEPRNFINLLEAVKKKEK